MRNRKLIIISIGAIAILGIIGMRGAFFWNRPPISSQSEPIQQPDESAKQTSPDVSIPEPSVAESAQQESDINETTQPAPRRPELFPGSKVLTEEVTPPNADGVISRVQLLETDFKYPLVRVIDKLQKNAKGEAVMIDRVAMVADHVNVQKGPALSDTAFREAVQKAGASVLKQVSEDGVYVVAFDGRDVHALDKIIEELNRQGAGEIHAEPDFIRFNY